MYETGNIIYVSFPAITLYVLITNTISLNIFSRKRFQNTTFSTYNRFYLGFSTFCALFSINKMLESNLNTYFSRISDFTCKIRFYFAFSSFSVIAWFLVVISIDRFLSISYPSRFLFRKKGQFQIFLSFFIILYHLLFYIQSLFYHLKETNITHENNMTVQINYDCVSPGLWAILLDLFQSTVIPFLLMILFTVLTIKTVFNSRRSTSSNSIRTKDIKFALATIIINFSFILFNFPYFFIAIIKDHTNLFDNLNELYEMLDSFTYFLFYTNLGFTFFVDYFVNSMFRKELDSIFKNFVNSL